MKVNWQLFCASQVIGYYCRYFVFGVNIIFTRHICTQIVKKTFKNQI